MQGKPIFRERTLLMLAVVALILHNRKNNLELAYCRKVRRGRHKWCELFWENWDNNEPLPRFTIRRKKITKSGDWELIKEWQTAKN